MKRKEFKEKLFDALKSDVDNMSYDEKMILVNNLLIDFEKENEYLRDTSNKGQKWKDERKEDSFICQIKKVAKELGLRG